MPGMPEGSNIEYSDYKCRPFPARVADACEEENRNFCVLWTTAGYLAELGAGFAVVSCLALVFGVSTRARRRRIWEAVAVLVAMHGKHYCVCLVGGCASYSHLAAISLIATFAIVTDTYSNATFPIFDRARPGMPTGTSVSCCRLTFSRHCVCFGHCGLDPRGLRHPWSRYHRSSRQSWPPVGSRQPCLHSNRRLILAISSRLALHFSGSPHGLTPLLLLCIPISLAQNNYVKRLYDMAKRVDTIIVRGCDKYAQTF